MDNLGENARASLITRGLAEMVRVGVSLGARRETFYGLSGVGDLFFEYFNSLLPIGLGFGGGAMIYITAKEVFPEAYSEGKHTQSTVAILVGLGIYLLRLF